MPSEQRTRAAAVNELHAAEKDDLDAEFPVAGLLHLLDDKGEPTKILCVDVFDALSEAVKAEVAQPGSKAVRAGADPEAGIRQAVAAADLLRRRVVAAIDGFKLNKKRHEALRLALLGERVPAKSRAEWEVEIGEIATALRKFGDYRTSAELICLDMDMNFDAKLAKALQAGGAFPDNDADLDRALGLLEEPMAAHAEALEGSGFDKAQQAGLLAIAGQFHEALTARPKEKEALVNAIDERHKVLKKLRNNTRYMRKIGRAATKRTAARADFDRKTQQSEVTAKVAAAKQAGAKVKRTGVKLATETKEAEEKIAAAEAARAKKEARKAARKKGK